MEKKVFLGSLSTALFGHAAWISAGVNFVWMLFKDATLFSWWIPIGLAAAFLLSLGISIKAVLKGF